MGSAEWNDHNDRKCNVGTERVDREKNGSATIIHKKKILPLSLDRTSAAPFTPR